MGVNGGGRGEEEEKRRGSVARALTVTKQASWHEGRGALPPPCPPSLQKQPGRSASPPISRHDWLAGNKDAVGGSNGKMQAIEKKGYCQ